MRWLFGGFQRAGVAAGALGGLALFGGVLAARPAEAQTLKACTIGAHVVDERGAKGVIKGNDAGFCDIQFDNGKRDTRMFYVLRPAADAGKETSAAPLANGEYDCAVSSGAFSHPNVVPMGRMDINGGAYRFRPLGKVINGFSPYAVGPDGALRWSGPMGALGKAPSKLLDSRKTPEGFNVRYLARPGADADTMSCHHV